MKKHSFCVIQSIRQDAKDAADFDAPVRFDAILNQWVAVTQHDWDMAEKYLNDVKAMRDALNGMTL